MELPPMKSVSDGLQLLGEIFLKMVHYIMYYAPIGLGAYFAALIGEFGPQLLSSYIDALVVYYPVCSPSSLPSRMLPSRSAGPSMAPATGTPRDRQPYRPRS